MQAVKLGQDLIVCYIINIQVELELRLAKFVQYHP